MRIVRNETYWNTIHPGDGWHRWRRAELPPPALSAKDAGDDTASFVAATCWKSCSSWRTFFLINSWIMNFSSGFFLFFLHHHRWWFAVRRCTPTLYCRMYVVTCLTARSCHSWLPGRTTRANCVCQRSSLNRRLAVLAAVNSSNNCSNCRGGCSYPTDATHVYTVLDKLVLQWVTFHTKK